MKTHCIPFIAACFALMLTSCSQDGIVDNDIAPSFASSKSGLSLDATLSSGNSQEFSFYAASLLTKELMAPDNGKSLDQVTKQPTQAISGFGDSEVNGSGSWRSDVDLVYNPNADAVSGNILLRFPDYGDHVEFVVYGGPAQVIIGGHADLNMQLAILDGSGRFARAKFDGKAVIKAIDKLSINQSYTELIIQGTLISDGE